MSRMIDRAGVGAVGADVGIPAGPAVGVDLDALDRPVAQAAGVDAVQAHAVDVDVMQPDVAGAAGRDADRAQLPNGAEVRLQAAEAVVCADTQLLLSVISRKPTSTLELPLRFSTLQVPSAPHSFGGAAALPRMRVLAVGWCRWGSCPASRRCDRRRCSCRPRRARRSRSCTRPSRSSGCRRRRCGRCRCSAARNRGASRRSSARCRCRNTRVGLAVALVGVATVGAHEEGGRLGRTEGAEAEGGGQQDRGKGIECGSYE